MLFLSSNDKLVYELSLNFYLIQFLIVLKMRVYLFVGVFFFLKQKTAYEMRISDWSSDVCSSDLAESSSAAAASIARASSFRHRAAMTRSLTIAALQLPLPGPVRPNIDAVSALAEEAVAKGAQVILPPELFEGPYFCQVEEAELFASARPDRKSTLLNSSH